jgi:hypothetical protein
MNQELRQAVRVYGNDLDSLADGFRNVVRVAARELDKAEGEVVIAQATATKERERREQAESELREYVEGKTD